MRKIKIVPDQVYALSDQFRANVNSITKMIAMIDSDIKNLSWDSHQRQQFSLSWERQKSDLVQSTNTLDNLSYQIHRKAELLVQADEEGFAALEKIRPVIDEIYFDIVTREGLLGQIAQSQKRLEEAEAAMQAAADKADLALQRELAALEKLMGTEAMQDVENARLFLTDQGLENGPWKSFLTWALVTGDDMGDFLGINGLLEYFESYETGSDISTEAAIHATLSAIKHEAGLVFGAGKESWELSTGVTQAVVAKIRSMQSNRAMNRFFEAQSVVDQIQQEIEIFEGQLNQFPRS